MPFDIGFNFRSSSGYVTDPSYGVPVLGEAYPHTYTAGNGNSINAGFVTGPTGVLDRASGNDPRIAGVNYFTNSAPIIFQVDLSSGSAPGAGTYAVDSAHGDPAASWTQSFELYDNTTRVIDGTNGGSGFTPAAGHFRDTTLTDVTASTTWTGTTVSQAFATTTVKLKVGLVGGSFGTLAHFRLTLATVAGLSIPVAMHHYRQRRN